MVYRPTFGRRVSTQPQAFQAKPTRPVAPPDDGQRTDARLAGIEPAAAAVGPPPSQEPAIDEELHEWKRQRQKAYSIPWRQLSLMSGLCFGIASFVLPDSVSDAAQWLLYALAAAGLYAGFRKRRDAKTDS